MFSPGVFPGPVDSQKLDLGITYVRNHAIAKILWESSYVEKMGSGFITLFKSYKEWGLEPPQVIEGTNFIKVILPRKALGATFENEEDRVLQFFYLGKSITRNDVVRDLKIPKTTAIRLLNKLTNEGKIIRTGKGRGVIYKLI